MLRNYLEDNLGDQFGSVREFVKRELEPGGRETAIVGASNSCQVTTVVPLDFG
jgi:hypothetical protein